MTLLEKICKYKAAFPIDPIEVREDRVVWGGAESINYSVLEKALEEGGQAAERVINIRFYYEQTPSSGNVGIILGHTIGTDVFEPAIKSLEMYMGSPHEELVLLMLKEACCIATPENAVKLFDIANGYHGTEYEYPVAHIIFYTRSNHVLDLSSLYDVLVNYMGTSVEGDVINLLRTTMEIDEQHRYPNIRPVSITMKRVFANIREPIERGPPFGSEDTNLQHLGQGNYHRMTYQDVLSSLKRNGRGIKSLAENDQEAAKTILAKMKENPHFDPEEK